jgi:hypothetical protein
MTDEPKDAAPKDAADDQLPCETALLRLMSAARDVRRRRDMTAAEPPATQEAWDRLQLAVLEAERVLRKPN